LNDYLQQREMEFQSKPCNLLNEIVNNEPESPEQKSDSLSTPILSPPAVDQQTGLCELSNEHDFSFV
jgi:hypothetical protein